MRFRYPCALSLSRFVLIGFITIISAKKLYPQQAAPENEAAIRLNQIGFYPDWPKTAIVLSTSGGDFDVENIQKEIVFKGKLKKSIKPSFAGNPTWIADFSVFSKPGKYFVHVAGVGDS